MQRKMKCVIKAAPGPGHIEIAERPVPVPGPGDVLIRVHAVAVCGTDVHIADWNQFASDRMTPPSIIGHEFSGEVVAVGSDVAHVHIGDAVSAETHIVCHVCTPCRHNAFHVCSHTKTIGLSRDGALAQYIAIPAENAIVFPRSYSWDVLSLMEPFVAAVHAVRQCDVAGASVAVIGCGPIGAMAVGVAKACGASRVIAIEPQTKRLEMAGILGADYLINPAGMDVASVVAEANDGQAVDVAIDFSGNVQAIQSALDYIRPAGQMAVLGLSDKQLQFRLDQFVYRGLTIKGIAGRSMYSDWEAGKGLLQAGLDISPIITHVLPMDEVAQALELMRSGQCCKCILTVT